LGSGTADLAWFSSCQWTFPSFASNGTVDWDNNGVADNRHLAEDIDFFWYSDQNPSYDCDSPLKLLRLNGFDDWAHLLATASADKSVLQSTAFAESGTSELDQEAADYLLHPELHRPHELDFETARKRHVLLPPRPATLVLQPGCLTNLKTSGSAANGAVSVALLNTDDFDVNQVDLSSLRLHHAKPVSTMLQDVNGDGVPDLVIWFRGSEVQLSTLATRARITGWLKNSQVFVGESDITPAPDRADCLSSQLSEASAP